MGAQWNEVRQVMDGSWAARVSAAVDCFWALRGDRLDGLDFYFDHLYARVGRVRLCRAMVGDHLVWDLQIDELAPRR